MYNRKIISCRNERKIYHNPCCMYVKRMLSENAMDISKAEAEKHGYQACKYCNSMNSHYHSSEKSLSHYTETVSYTHLSMAISSIESLEAKSTARSAAGSLQSS